MYLLFQHLPVSKKFCHRVAVSLKPTVTIPGKSCGNVNPLLSMMLKPKVQSRYADLGENEKFKVRSPQKISAEARVKVPALKSVSIFRSKVTKGIVVQTRKLQKVAGSKTGGTFGIKVLKTCTKVVA